MNNSIEIVRRNWTRVLEEVAAAAERCGRDPSGIQIIGVTKYVDWRLTRALVDAGCEQLGESRPQMLWDKASALVDVPCQWHLIGPLQRNKVRRTLPLVTLIHSVDSAKLAESLDRVSLELDRTCDVLLEVNISGDAAKQGLAPRGVLEALDAIAPLDRIRVRGLMGMAGLDSSPAEARGQFALLRQCRDAAIARGLPDTERLEHLSMGMSDDFPLAIAEGATMVRIGSRLFDGCAVSEA